MAWKKGPLPPDTWGWGGVVTIEEAGVLRGFFWAEFQGDFVKAYPAKNEHGYLDHRPVKPDEVVWYDNSLELPPGRIFEMAKIL